MNSHADADLGVICGSTQFSLDGVVSSANIKFQQISPTKMNKILYFSFALKTIFFLGYDSVMIDNLVQNL